MLIGKPGTPTTSIATADADSIEIRGRDLCTDLMGRLSYTEFFFMLVTGHEPTEDQRYFLDVLLLSIAEHGLTPTVQAARMTQDAAPDSLQSALAAGILGCGTVVLGTSEQCAELLNRAAAEVTAGQDPEQVVDTHVRALFAAGAKLPGFGHPLHRPLDPRTQRILSLVEERGVDRIHVDLARRFPAAVERVYGKPLPMNVSMAIAAVMLDLDFPASMVKAIPLLARTGGILAHLAEEQTNPIGFLMASHGEAAISYQRDAQEKGA